MSVAAGLCYKNHRMFKFNTYFSLHVSHVLNSKEVMFMLKSWLDFTLHPLDLDNNLSASSSENYHFKQNSSKEATKGEKMRQILIITNYPTLHLNS